MTLDQQIKKLASASAFTANAILELQRGDPVQAANSLYFVRRDIMQVEASLVVAIDPKVRESLGLPLVKGGCGRDDYTPKA